MCNAFVINEWLDKSFFIAQGILNYQGENTLAVSLWAEDVSGGKLNSLAMQLTGRIESTMPSIVNQPAPAWSPRSGAY